MAQFRCDEISAGALAEFNEQAKPQKRPIEAGQVVSGLGEMMKNWRTQALGESFFLELYCRTRMLNYGFLFLLARYDRDASRYHKGVYTRKRTDLIGVIDSILSPLFLGQLKNLSKTCLVTFKKEILEGLKGEAYDFGKVVQKAQTKCETTFSTGATEALIEDTDWSWEDELEALKDEVRIVADQCRKDETKKMVNLIEVSVNVVTLLDCDLHLCLAKYQKTRQRACGA